VGTPLNLGKEEAREAARGGEDMRTKGERSIGDVEQGVGLPWGNDQWGGFGRGG